MYGKSLSARPGKVLSMDLAYIFGNINYNIFYMSLLEYDHKKGADIWDE